MIIISGGQTGVDRAALDVAIKLNISHGGWCPKGRIAEDGVIDKKYHLKEMSSANVNSRTKKNINASDGTMILVPCLPLPTDIRDGTLLTIEYVNFLKKPNLIIDLSDTQSCHATETTAWLSNNNIVTLNIAGPRESSCRGMYQKTYNYLCKLFSSMGVSFKVCKHS